MMSTAYQVKRTDPLVMDDIKVVFRGHVDGLNDLAEDQQNNAQDVEPQDHDDFDNEGQDDDTDQEDQGDDTGYVKSIYATITGCEITSRKRKTLGRVKADLLQVHRVVQNRESLW